jgi:hypothetical protein
MYKVFYIHSTFTTRMPRPAIKDDLATEVRRIHSQTHNEEANSFQEALDTVVQLARENQSQNHKQTGEREGWYPGKYASKAIKTVVNDIKTDARGNPKSPPDNQSEESHQPVPDMANLPYDPAAGMAVFKTRLGDDRSITVPQPEVDALEIGGGDLLQVVAYPWQRTDE